MRDHAQHIRKDRKEAITDLFAHCSFKPEIENVALTDACGRTLAQTMYSLHTLPNKPTSKMDALAVHFDEIEARNTDAAKWVLGEDYQYCNTGVAVPDGFDTAIAVEGFTWDGDKVLSMDKTPKKRGEGINQIGSTIKEGVELVKRGTRLKPAHVALLAMGGHTQAPVVVPPKVAFIPTGNELVEAQPSPPLGKNIDSNSYNICGKLGEWGAEPMPFDIVKDNWDDLKSALEKATRTCDIVVINAGSSKGSDDFTCEILEEYGEVLSHETDIAPGKHASCSILNGVPVIGISGPPMAADLNSIMFVKPIIKAFLTGKLGEPKIAWAKLGTDVEKPKMSHMNVAKRVKLYFDDDHELRADILEMDAPVLKDCAEADGIFVSPRGHKGFSAGDLVPVEII